METDRWAGKTVLVTGGMGFIGSHFVEELLAREARVISVHRREVPSGLDPRPRLRTLRLDLLDYAELRAACRYVAPRLDAIVHCAALDGNTEFKLRHSAQILDANLRIGSNVLNCAREYDVPDVVLMGSAEVYAGTSETPRREDDDYRRDMRYTANGYLLSKTFLEILAELHREQFGMRIFVPRPTNVYGPRDWPVPGSGRVIPTMLRRIRSGGPVEIWGDGSQSRTFVHVHDLVRATLRMVESRRHSTMNIGTDEPVSVLALAQLLFRLTGRPELIQRNPDKPTGAPNRVLDLSRMKETIGFSPRPLLLGLRETVAWLDDHERAMSGDTAARTAAA
ncbi:NAD-dependent epimerase/dehydratase family protein [Micromonospora sp. NPDC049903]|uniref:NAD-dependent epimerase/dehydratase family protein n=1 Tax=Micromonospora sp. NPDC049903 TaxID=3364276 RepID=UPI003789F167